MSSILFATVLMGWCGLTWRQALWALSAAGLVFAGLFLLLFRNSPGVDVDTGESLAPKKPSRSGQPTQRRTLPWGRAMSSRSMWFFLVQQINSAGADSLYSLFMGGYFLKVRGVDLQSAGLLVGMPLLGGAIGGMLGGFCNDLMIWLTGSRRWGRSIVGFTGKAISCALLLIAIQQTSATAAAIGLFAVKFFTDWSQPTVWGTCTDLGGRFSASVFSIINTSGTLGGVICPPIFGFILDVFSREQMVGGQLTVVPGYTMLFLVVAAMYIVSGVCWFFIDCSRSLDQDDAAAAA